MLRQGIWIRQLDSKATKFLLCERRSRWFGDEQNRLDAADGNQIPRRKHSRNGAPRQNNGQVSLLHRILHDQERRD